MDTVDTHHLIVSKENIQPLRQGRDTSKLCMALQAETDSELQQTLEKQRNEFEIRLRSKSDDPLSYWTEYIHWIEQSFPKQPREGKLNLILRKCLNKFKDSEKYKNDVRFVKLCIKYSEMEESTVELLSQIYRHGIGTKCSELYIAWAEKYAMNNCFKKANIIYEKGIENGAEPAELLKEAHQNFHAFLVRKMLNVKEEFKPTFLEPVLPESRQPYNVLRTVSSGQVDVVSNVRVGQNVKGSPGKLKMAPTQEKQKKSNVGIKIFEDNSNDPATMEPMIKLEKVPNRKKSSKENTVKAGPWTDKQKKKVPFTTGVSSVPFQVHRDEEEYEASNRSQNVPSSVLKSHKTKDYEDDSFANIPLFYLEPDDKSKVVMYCKDQVYAGGLEFQFEELRAIEYNRKIEENAKYCLIQTPKSVESECMSKSNCVNEYDKNESLAVVADTESVYKIENIQDSRSASTAEKSDCKSSEQIMQHRRRTLFLKSNHVEPVPENKGISEDISPSTDYSMNQTIHTKEALSEMQQLWFSKPASPLLHDSTITKQAGKSILKPTRPCFNLYIDESCLDNFKNPEGPEKPLDLTLKLSNNSDDPMPSVDHEVVQELNFMSRVEAKETHFKQTFEPPKSEIEDNENKENEVPDDYCGPTGKSTRRVTGILTLAENIPVAPLNDSEDDDNDNEEEDAIEYCGTTQCNVTGFTENLTKAFQFPRHESTPNFRKSQHHQEDFNRSLYEPDASESKNDNYHKNLDQKTNKPKLNSETETQNVLQPLRSPCSKEDNCTKNLSVIVETSREYKSSSSGSSGISTLPSRLFKNYPITPIDIKGAMPSMTSHHGLQKTKKLSLTGYEASTESINTARKSRTLCDRNENKKNADDLDILSEENLLNKDIEEKEEIVNEGLTSEKTFLVDVPGEIDLLNIDPFSETLLDQFLKSTGFLDTHLGNNERSSLTIPKLGSSVKLGSCIYEVKKILGEGSYAKVFYLTDVSNGNSKVAKIQKPPCWWEFYITEKLHLRIDDKLKAMFFMKIETAYFFQNASVLLMKPEGYGSLLDAINKLKQNQQLSHTLAVYFTVEILKILEILHACKIIHADIKPDNFLVTNRNEKPTLQLIDFGRSIDMTLFPRNISFKKVITTEGFTTTEMRMGKPWTYQVDLYGAANCSHCLLYGDYMNVTEKKGVWNITNNIPRYWARNDWKNYFSVLLNIESCDDIPCISTLAEPFEAMLKDDKELYFRLRSLNNLLKYG